MKRKFKNSFLFIAILSLCLAIYYDKNAVFAQTVTPTPTDSQNAPLITQTPSVTVTPTITTTNTVTPTEVVTETPTPTVKEDTLNAVVSVGTQSPWNKRIPVKVSVKPTVGGEKLEIRWQKKAGLVATPTTITLNSPKAGQTYTASFELTPYSTGYQRAVADIILTTKTTNIVISKDVTLQLNTKKVVIPITPTYVFYQVMMYVTIFLVFFVMIPFGVYKAFLYIKVHVYPKWLESKIQVPQ